MFPEGSHQHCQKGLKGQLRELKSEEDLDDDLDLTGDGDGKS